MDVPVVRWVLTVFLAVFTMLLLALPMTAPAVPVLCLALGLLVCGMLAGPGPRHGAGHRGYADRLH